VRVAYLEAAKVLDLSGCAAFCLALARTDCSRRKWQAQRGMPGT